MPGVISFFKLIMSQWFLRKGDRYADSCIKVLILNGISLIQVRNTHRINYSTSRFSLLMSEALVS